MPTDNSNENMDHEVRTEPEVPQGGEIETLSPAPSRAARAT